LVLARVAIDRRVDDQVLRPGRQVVLGVHDAAGHADLQQRRREQRQRPGSARRAIKLDRASRAPTTSRTVGGMEGQ